MAKWGIISGLVQIILLGALVGDARAQSESRFYVATVAGSLRVDADHAEGNRPMAGASIGIRLRPWADLEAEIGLAPGAVTRTFSGPLIAFRSTSASVDEFESHVVVARVTQQRETQALVSIGVRLHPPSPARLRPYAFAGLASHTVRDTRRVDALRLPPGVTQADVDRAFSAGAPWIRHLGGITVGGGVEIAVTRQLSLMPDVRYDYGSIGDEINNTLRTSVRVAWRF